MGDACASAFRAMAVIRFDDAALKRMAPQGC